jgi:hypothetical protein
MLNKEDDLPNKGDQPRSLKNFAVNTILSVITRSPCTTIHAEKIESLPLPQSLRQFLLDSTAIKKVTKRRRLIKSTQINEIGVDLQVYSSPLSQMTEEDYMLFIKSIAIYTQFTKGFSKLVKPEYVKRTITNRQINPLQDAKICIEYNYEHDKTMSSHGVIYDTRIDWLNPKAKDYSNGTYRYYVDNYEDFVLYAPEAKKRAINMLQKSDLTDRLYIASLIQSHINATRWRLENLPENYSVFRNQIYFVPSGGGMMMLDQDQRPPHKRSSEFMKEDIKILEDLLREHLLKEAEIVKAEKLDELYHSTPLEQEVPRQEEQQEMSR